jgi:DNA-directed RNA polymerase beta' subunit
MSLKDYIEFFLQDQDTSDLKELTSIELKNWIQKHQEVENLDGLIEELEEQEQEIEPFKEKMDQLYTRLNSVLTLSDFNDILLNMVTDVDLEDLRQRANKYGVPFYTGKILFSAALPRDLTFENSEILIKEGILVSGRVSSASVGTSHNSLVQILYKNYGPKTALNFTDDITFITNIFLSRYGFTVGLEDCMVPETKVQEAQKMLLESITESQSAAYRLSKQSRNQLENERRESQINEHLNTTRNVGTKIANYLSSENNLRVMLDSGAKGGVQNLAQMVSSAGQQYVNGKRHALMLSKGTRCLPTFEPGSEDIRARGQCYNSLMTGFTPSELYFHQAQGRVGLIDTALKTAEVGELHRNLVKMLEDIYVANDGSVRTGRNMTQNVIIQFVYGEDGFDAMNLQFTKNAFGNTPSFIDLEAEVKSLNTKYGF